MRRAPKSDQPWRVGRVILLQLKQCAPHCANILVGLAGKQHEHIFGILNGWSAIFRPGGSRMDRVLLLIQITSTHQVIWISNRTRSILLPPESSSGCEEKDGLS